MQTEYCMPTSHLVGARLGVMAGAFVFTTLFITCLGCTMQHSHTGQVIVQITGRRLPLRLESTNDITILPVVDYYENKGSSVMFSNVPFGKYIVMAEPDSEDWNSRCVAYTAVAVDSEQCTARINIPKETLNVTVFFDCRIPKFPLQYKIPLRIEKVCAGQLDSYFRQWLWVSKDSPHTGVLHYIEKGVYRITAFERLEGGSHDIALQDIIIDQEVINKSVLSVTIRQPPDVKN